MALIGFVKNFCQLMITTAGLSSLGVPGWAPPVFGRSIDPISTRKVVYAHHITMASQDFQILDSLVLQVTTPLEFGQSGKRTEGQMDKNIPSITIVLYFGPDLFCSMSLSCNCNPGTKGQRASKQTVRYT